MIEACADQARPSTAAPPQFRRWVPGVGVIEGPKTGQFRAPSEADFQACALVEIPTPDQLAAESDSSDTATSEMADAVVANAAREAEAILEQAHARARQLEQEAEDKVEALLLQRVNQELQRISDEQTAAFGKAAERVIDQLNQAAQTRIEDLSDRVAALVAGITSRVIRRKVAAEDDIIVGVVSEALQELTDAGFLRLVVNPADEAILSAHEQTLLKQLGKVSQLEIVTDSAVERGGCLIASDHGEIDARVSSQLDEIWKRVSTTDVLRKTA